LAGLAIASQLLAFLFAGLTLSRLVKSSRFLDVATLISGLLLLAVVAVTGHAIDDGLPKLDFG